MGIDALITAFMWFVAAVAVVYAAVTAVAVTAACRGDRLALIPAVGYGLCASGAAVVWIYMAGS